MLSTFNDTGDWQVVRMGSTFNATVDITGRWGTWWRLPAGVAHTLYFQCYRDPVHLSNLGYQRMASGIVEEVMQPHEPLQRPEGGGGNTGLCKTRKTWTYKSDTVSTGDYGLSRDRHGSACRGPSGSVRGRGRGSRSG